MPLPSLPRRRALVAAATAACAVAAASAPADSGRRADPAGDAQPGFTDIRAIKHAHSGGKLRHVVKVAEADAATRTLAQLEVRARGTLYLISAFDVSAFPAQQDAAHSAQAGDVDVRRRGRRVVFTFPPSVIGSPRAYRWAATVGSNDTSPLEFDRAPNTGTLRHDLRARFRGFHAGVDGKPRKRAIQGELHQFKLVDRRRQRVRYELVLRTPAGMTRRHTGRTDDRGRDAIEDSLYVNDVGGPGRWRAVWRVKGKRVASHAFTLVAEPEG